MVKEYACRKCKSLTTGRVCANCQSTELSSEWSGLVVIFDTEKSEISKTLNIDKTGRYAIRVA